MATKLSEAQRKRVKAARLLQAGESGGPGGVGSRRCAANRVHLETGA